MSQLPAEGHLPAGAGLPPLTRQPVPQGERGTEEQPGMRAGREEGRHCRGQDLGCGVLTQSTIWWDTGLRCKKEKKKISLKTGDSAHDGGGMEAGTGKVESSGLGDPPHPVGGKEGTDLGRGRGPPLACPAREGTMTPRL